MSEPFRVGLLGHGTVGSAFAGLLAERADAIATATGRRPEIAGVLTRSRGDFDGDPRRRRRDRRADRRHRARPRVRARALGAGKGLVTANKQLLSRHGDELWRRPARAARSFATRPRSPASCPSSA